MFKTWLEDINFKLLPKSVSISHDHLIENNGDGPVFITNQRTDSRYNLDGVEYLIDAPIEIHIISIIWCICCGPLLENNMDKGVFANRLDNEASAIDNSKLFKLFHGQYSLWRDSAIKEAQDLHSRKRSVAFISLDISKFFYNLKIDWQRLFQEIEEKSPEKRKLTNKFLTTLLRRVHRRYWKVTKKYLEDTHSLTQRVDMLPIGLKSSGILSNWALIDFDRIIRKKLNPEYYGRYCDDMLIVVRDPNKRSIQKGFRGIIDHYFKDILKLISQSDGADKNDSDEILPKEPTYELIPTDSLKIQAGKLLVQYFDKDHSAAGINEFARQIARVASEFRFLPGEELKQELDHCAFDVLYKGSVNKFRSVVGLAENSTELAKYLGRQLIAHRLSNSSSVDNVSQQLTRFYQGRNAFDFCRLWERVFSFLIIDKGTKTVEKFYTQIHDLIDKLYHNKAHVTESLRLDLKEYLDLAVSMTTALLDIDSINDYEKDSEFISSAALSFRKSNLIRHHLVSFPLINYTSFSGDLHKAELRDFESLQSWDISKTTEFSPRFIHFDECQLFCWAKKLYSSDDINIENFDEFRTHSISDCAKGKCPLSATVLHDDIVKSIDQVFIEELPVELSRLTFKNSKKIKEDFKVGIANIKASSVDILNSYHPSRDPNLSFERQSKLYDLINTAQKEKCDLLVLPEVSVPYHWLPFMVAHSRRSQMGIVFGVEHCVVKNKAYNFMATVLPFRDEEKYKSSFVSLRLKNHYAPGEANDIKKYRLEVPKPNPERYEIFRWRGVDFSVFNCFELADIRHRALLRSRVDFLVAAIWNKDVNYYSSIVESACRDIHCYIVQVNTSKYGDSRVTQPTSKHEMNLVQVKGGENTSLLTCSLDIQSLRDHQIKEYGEEAKRFKPTPPGFDHDEVIKRARYRKKRR